MKVEVYSDGSGTTAQTPGGYGFVVVIDGVKMYEGSGHLENATNNDCELQGAIEGLNSINEVVGYLEPKTEVVLVSDSEIILGWADGTNAFRQEEKIDKYYALRNLMATFKAKTRWVPGHTGDEHNEQCDKLANAARLQVK
ncbi:MAG: ribonuclease HI [bacterium]